MDGQTEPLGEPVIQSSEARWFELLRTVIPGEAVPWPRARINRTGKYYMPRAYITWRQEASAAMLHAAHSQHGLKEPTPDPIRLVVGVFRLTRRRADIDNFAKAVMDAGTGVVWIDDSQVSRLVVDRMDVPAEPRLEVLAYRLEQ